MAVQFNCEGIQIECRVECLWRQQLIAGVETELRVLDACLNLQHLQQDLRTKSGFVELLICDSSGKASA
jgi:hypothetical protein